MRCVLMFNAIIFLRRIDSSVCIFYFIFFAFTSFFFLSLSFAVCCYHCWCAMTRPLTIAPVYHCYCCCTHLFCIQVSCWYIFVRTLIFMFVDCVIHIEKLRSMATETKIVGCLQATNNRKKKTVDSCVKINYLFRQVSPVSSWCSILDGPTMTSENVVARNDKLYQSQPLYHIDTRVNPNSIWIFFGVTLLSTLQIELLLFRSTIFRNKREWENEQT